MASDDALDRIVAASVFNVRSYMRGGHQVRSYARGGGVSLPNMGVVSRRSAPVASPPTPSPRVPTRSSVSRPRPGSKHEGSLYDVYRRLRKIMSLAQGNPGALISAGKVRRSAMRNPEKSSQGHMGHLLEMHSALSQLHRDTNHPEVARLRDRVASEMGKKTSKSG